MLSMSVTACLNEDIDAMPDLTIHSTAQVSGSIASTNDIISPARLSALPSLISAVKVNGMPLPIYRLKQARLVLHDEEMTDDIRTDLLVRLAECNNLNFDSNKLAMPDFNDMQPYIYNEERRAVAQAELDAIFAHLYGLTTEELHYILAPEDVCGKGCINETFRVLRDNEIRQYGEYRTKRLVLEAWNKFGFDNQE